MNSGSAFSSTPAPVGMIGLGLIGTALIERMRTARVPVLGYDIDPGRREALRGVGVGMGEDPAAVFARCDRVLLSLPTHREVNEVLTTGATALRARQIIVDTTTGDPASSAAIAAMLGARGIHYLDATISGSSAQVRTGAVTLMVGGDSTAVATCRDLFSAIGQKTFHTGPAGTGARMKLVTNLVLGLNRAALAEGLVFAEALGLDPTLALEVMRGSAAQSKIMDSKGERMIRREFAPPDARLSQHLKDVRLILEAGRAAGLPMTLSEAHRAVLEAAEAAGYGDLDNSALIKALEQRQRPGDGA